MLKQLFFPKQLMLQQGRIQWSRRGSLLGSRYTHLQVRVQFLFFPRYFLRFSATGYWFIFTFDIAGRRKTRPVKPGKKYADLPMMKNSHRAAKAKHEISKSLAIKLLGKPVKECRPKFFPVFRYIDIHFHKQTDTKIYITKHGGYKAPVSEWVDKASPTTIIMDWFCCFMFFLWIISELLWKFF